MHKKLKISVKFFRLLLVILLLNNNANSQYLVSCNFLNSSSSSLLSGATGLVLDFDVDMYKMTYNTINTQGIPTIATGAFCIPANTTCKNFPFAIYNHGTSLRKDNVPSYNNSEALIGKVFSAGGYFVCMPDYIGMGDSPGLHPYVHAETEATAAIDMVRAAREYLANNTSFMDNGETFITGYSQGGHACMATHKYIQDQNLTNEFNVIASAPCSGPYDLSGIMADTIISPTPYSNPGYIVYLLASYQLAYGNIFSSWSDVLYPPFDTIVSPFFSGNNTSLDMSLLNSLIPNDMSLLIRDTCMNNFMNDSVNMNHPWWVALLENDNYDWLPIAPIRMYYCTGDEQIAYTNALNAEAAMNNNGALDVQAVNVGNGNHGNCVLPALSAAFNWFQTLKTPCDFTNSKDVSKLNTQISPNPFKEKIMIESSEIIDIEIFSPVGKSIYFNSNIKDFRIETSSWPKGVYIVKTQSGKNLHSSILIKN